MKQQSVSTREQTFSDLVSGKTCGVSAQLARTGLAALSVGYRIAIGFRNALFDLGLRKSHRADVPVISVGNLTTGGTGKTPVVAFLVHQLQAMGYRPGIISRGYRTVDAQGNDEKRVLARICPGVPHEQNPSRILAAQRLLQSAAVETCPDVIVMDDGFQHRQLHRDLNILLIDATNPFGFGHLLPRGFLREPLTSLKRADLVMITRADMVESNDLEHIFATVRSTNTRLADAALKFKFQSIDAIDAFGNRTTLQDLARSPVLLVSGIGNPSAFAATCQRSGLTIADRIWFPDHHHFHAADIAAIQEKQARHNNAQIVVTLKDLVKLPDSLPAKALNIEAVSLQPNDVAQVQSLLSSAIERRKKSAF